jgi:hypothetical protein
MATYISRTLGTPTDNKKWTFSAWVKVTDQSESDRGLFNVGGNASGYTRLNFAGSHQLEYDNKISPSAWDGRRFATARRRDPAAWYHIVAVFDSDNGTPADRMITYFNGERITAYDSALDPSSGAVSGNVSGETCRIGVVESTAYFNGEMSWVQFVDGAALAPTEFGEVDATSGIWTIKTDVYGTPGNNGFCLKMEDRTNLDLDSSSNAHTFSTTGTLTATYDNPDNNFATWNPVAIGAGMTGLSNGSTTVSLSDYSFNVRSTLPMASGKWYWEGKQSAADVRFGVTTANSTANLDTDNAQFKWEGSANGGIYLALSSTGASSWQLTNNDTSQNISTYTTAAVSGADDIIMVALNVDTGKMWFGLNGTWFNSGDPAAGTNAVMTITNSSPDPLVVFGGFGTSSARVLKMNFGNGYFGTDAVTSGVADSNGVGQFEYTPPTGFLALCTKNLGSDS